MSDELNSIPPPSPQAVQSIVEAIELLEKGQSAQAARLLQGCFRIVSPRMIAFDLITSLNDAIGAGNRRVNYRNPMEFDRFHYADAAIRLNLAEEVEDEEMRETIEAVRASQPEIEVSIELMARFEKLGRARGSRP